MLTRLFPRSFFTALAALGLALILSACGGGGGGGSDGGATSGPLSLGGSVGDGPVVGATVAVTDANGATISTTSDAFAQYQIEIPAGAAYPLSIVVSGGTDLVSNATPDFTMRSIVADGSSAVANINPFSTLVVKTAMAMPGGANATNLRSAKTAVMDQLGFGLDRNVFADPVTTPVSDLNIAAIVKASEALGEMIRRTRSSLLVAGYDFTEDQIIDSLAADMTDFVIDGRGTGASARISATANIVTAQVLIESMSNNLNVGNANATARLDTAIALTRPSATLFTGGVLISADMISQASTAIAAAQALAPSGTLTSIQSALGALSPNSTSAVAGATLPPTSAQDIDQAVMLVAAGTDTDLETVNAIVRQTSSGGTGGGGSGGGGIGTASLSWVPPTTSADGTALADLAGYRIYRGDSPGNYPSVITINNAGLTAYVVDNLPAGDHYFAISAFDTSGNESSLSNVATKRIN